MIKYSEFEKICKDLNLRICGNYIFTDEKYTYDIIINGILANTDTECIGHVFSEKYRYEHQNIKPSPNEIVWEFNYLDAFVTTELMNHNHVYSKFTTKKIFFNNKDVRNCLEHSKKEISYLAIYSKRFKEKQAFNNIKEDFE